VFVVGVGIGIGIGQNLDSLASSNLKGHSIPIPTPIPTTITDCLAAYRLTSFSLTKYTPVRRRPSAFLQRDRIWSLAFSI